MIKYFDDLREQIMNEKMWDKDRFAVFSHEAGSGKSQETLRFIGEMAKGTTDKFLYVQKFVKNGEMDETVATINKHAGKRVAEQFHSKMTVRQQNAVKNAQILVIAHQMYLQVCKDKRIELERNRDVLIIDEYPDQVERVTLNLRDVCELWGCSNDKYLENLADLLKKKLNDCLNKKKKNVINYVDFNEIEFEQYKKLLLEPSDKMAGIIGQSILEKLQQILANGCFYYENAFHTFNNQLKLHAFKKNNIILDANSFDHRYLLSPKFSVRQQEKLYEYSSTTLQHISTKTDKTSLKKQINLAEKVFDKISLENKGKTLIVTDIENSDSVKEKAFEYLSKLGLSKNEIEEKVKVDHFGNLIGVNCYRDFESVVILKTPFHDYLSYVLTYFYFRSQEVIGKKEKMEDIELFKNEEVEKIRKTIVAGEIYQALKRINRDNSRSAQMVVCTDYQEAIDLVAEQLPSIQYTSDSLEVNEKKAKVAPANSSKVRVAIVEKFLFEQMKAGVKEVRKKVIKELVGITDSGNFKRTILNKLALFFKQHDIQITNNCIILNR